MHPPCPSRKPKQLEGLQLSEGDNVPSASSSGKGRRKVAHTIVGLVFVVETSAFDEGGAGWGGNGDGPG